MPLASAKVTSKGQITLPASLRKELGLKPGDRVDFERTSNGKFEMSAKTGSFMDLRGMLKTSIVLSDEELEAAIRESWGTRWRAAQEDEGTEG